jgi:hypothetical protein
MIRFTLTKIEKYFSLFLQKNVTDKNFKLLLYRYREFVTLLCRCDFCG